MIKNQKGFTLVLSLVLLLAMSLMGGALIVVASSDHQGNNSSDEFQQTFFVAETALMQAEKSLIDKMAGPLDENGNRRTADRYIPINASVSSPAPNETPCFKSFRNLSRSDNFRVIEQIENQSFFSLIEPIFTEGELPLNDITDPNAIVDEQTKLRQYRYEFFSVNSGTSVYKGSGGSLKKTSETTQRQGTAYRIFGCGMMGNVNNPQILIPLEKIIVLSH